MRSRNLFLKEVVGGTISFKKTQHLYIIHDY